ncbi:phage portal protein [Salininema proteolyticum]|uniref:Phage portal protein n=1 Tax=Salininema proteolyticum TaxID=1607685 RepID=A0ABV8TTK9_9ACTN
MSPAPDFAKALLEVLHKDIDVLDHIDSYLHGDHADPYMPANADDEYRLLAKRAVSNWCPLLVSTPAQAMFVDSVRRGDSNAEFEQDLWTHWQASRLDARQLAVHRSALAYGHSFTVTEKRRGRWITRGLSPLTTTAIFDDPAADDEPAAALHVITWPSEGTKPSRGTAVMWDRRHRYDITFNSLSDPKSATITGKRSHGLPECPVTRFASTVDLDGRTTGVLAPVIPLQDRINQTIFDLLVAQTYSSTQVRFATGMAPPIKRDPETGKPILDQSGNEIPLPINHNARRFLFAPDPDSKFGSLPPSPLDGLINAVELGVRHLSAVAQTPPHYLLGQLVNLSGEALMAAETSLLRKVTEFQNAFGESWERAFRLAAIGMGLEGADDADFSLEVLWRDMEMRSLAQSADGLGKLAESLEIPRRGLWTRVPGVTDQEIQYWESLAADSDMEKRLASLAFDPLDDGGDARGDAPASTEP